jgi:hypothetical protein
MTHGEKGVDHSTPAEGSAKRAFLIAPAAADLFAIRQVLRRHGIDSFTAEEVNLPGGSLADVIQEGIGRADLIVAVLGDRDPSVFFELGFARALRKRTLVLVNDDELVPMLGSFGLFHLRTQPNNVEVIEFGLSLLLKAPPHNGNRRANLPEPTKPIGPFADELLKILSFIRDKPLYTQFELEQLVMQAISRSGVSAMTRAEPPSSTSLVESYGYTNLLDTATTRAEPPSSTPALAVWSDDLEPWIANPLLIQVRTHLPKEEELKSLSAQMSGSTSSANMSWALLIYGDTGNCQHEPPTLQGSRILAISLEKFLTNLRTIGFGELIWRLRNERVHGRS